MSIALFTPISFFWAGGLNSHSQRYEWFTASSPQNILATSVGQTHQGLASLNWDQRWVCFSCPPTGRLVFLKSVSSTAVLLRARKWPRHTQLLGSECLCTSCQVHFLVSKNSVNCCRKGDYWGGMFACSLLDVLGDWTIRVETCAYFFSFLGNLLTCISDLAHCRGNMRDLIIWSPVDISMLSQ